MSQRVSVDLTRLVVYDRSKQYISSQPGMMTTISSYGRRKTSFTSLALLPDDMADGLRALSESLKFFCLNVVYARILWASVTCLLVHERRFETSVGSSKINVTDDTYSR